VIGPDDLTPQPGPQLDFLSTPADIAIYGGAAGGGKTFALLLEPIRHLDNPQFGSVIFRRQAVQITNEGGLFDTSFMVYPIVEGSPRLSPTRSWVFPSGSSITFNHLNTESDILNWQGAQIPLIGFDELTHFTENQFWYMLSRNRSTCGVKPYIRATCNPDADSWVAELIEWYIDQNTGYPITARSGKIRYVARIDGHLKWANSSEELVKEYPGSVPKSFTFIAATLADNKRLIESDPSYEANLRMLNRVEQERLLHGNWKIKPIAGSYFPAYCVGTLPVVPTDVRVWVRRWDLAATEPSEANPSPDASASILMGRRSNGRFVIANGITLKKGAHIVRDVIKHTAAQDKANYGRVITVLPQDPGQAGKDQVASMTSMLAGYAIKSVRETGPKETRAEPLSAQWQVGNIDIVEGQWNKEYLSQMESFPSKGIHDDYVDASSGAFLECISGADLDARRRALSE
jgi:predicted phage terminase large subunit-like protein